MTDKQYFQYDIDAITHLKHQDDQLGEQMDRIGKIEREIIPDLFAGLINCIVGQQISNRAAATVWQRMLDRFGEISPQIICDRSQAEIQTCGITMRKAGTIKNLAMTIQQGDLNLPSLHTLSDEAVIQTLIRLPGIGIWTAEMILIFSMQRLNVLSWGDLAIRRGITLLYRETQLDKTRFETYRTRYAPYGSVASLYLWQIAKEN